MKLLIVEDDHFFQKFYSQKLTEAGYQVEVAADGNEGLAKMASFQPNVILLDMIMPNKDGFEVLEAKANNPQLKPIPVIVFSTLGDENDVKRAMQLGALDYINKSFHDIELLKSKISSHISGNVQPVQPIQQAAVAQQPAPPAPPAAQPAAAPATVAQPPTQPPVTQPQPPVAPALSALNTNGTNTGST